MVIFMQAMIYYITQQFTTLLVFYCLQVLCVCSVASGGVGKVHRQRHLGSFAPGDICSEEVVTYLHYYYNGQHRFVYHGQRRI